GDIPAAQRTDLRQRVRRKLADNPPPTQVPLSTRVIAVASGKGGVGKSSVTVNLAAALALRGLDIGVLDADIWGFSVPRMLGVSGRLAAGDDRRIRPNEAAVGEGRVGGGSMGFP